MQPMKKTGRRDGKMALNQTLEALLEHKTVEAVREPMQNALKQMVCDETAPVPLGMDAVIEAIAKPGEFLLLQMDYADFRNEPESQKVVRLMHQAPAILATFEDDGEHRKSIEAMLRYIHDRLDFLQTFRFGIKKVDHLSPHPVTILFADMHPINQLEIHLGSEVARHIEREREILDPLFKEFRFRLSKAIGLPILPIDSVVDDALEPNRVILTDPVTQKKLCSFLVSPLPDIEGIYPYLERLYEALYRLATGQVDLS